MDLEDIMDEEDVKFLEDDVPTLELTIAEVSRPSARFYMEYFSKVLVYLISSILPFRVFLLVVRV